MRNLNVSLLLLLIAACGSYMADTTSTPNTGGQTESSNQPPTTFQVAQVDLPRDTASSVSEQQIADLAQRGNDFAAELYRQAITNSDQNLTFSPYSITQTFSMLYAGAQNETESELAQVFSYLPQETQHETLNALDQQVTTPGSVTEGYGAPFELNIVNALWGQQNFPFREAFLTTLAQQYGAGMYTLDFVNQPDPARQTINDWVAQQTNDRIPELLPANSIDELTRMVLTNAVYFKATWSMPFNEAATQPGTFTLIDQSTVEIPMMQHDPIRTLYVEHESYQATRLGYAGNTVEMWVVLPREDRFTAVEGQLSGAFFDELRNQAEQYDVTLSLPKFEIKSSLQLKPLLQSMGVVTAFDKQTADFSAIVEKPELFVADAFHESTIIVDEQGTEATAATGAIVIPQSMVQEAEMNINRPFIFAIVDRETGAILFLGRVMNPADGG
ncbi:MAG: serpin family protein [Chloroflexota bacterium]